MDNYREHPSGMKQERVTGPQSPAPVAGREIDLIDVLIVLAKQRKLIIGFPLLMTIIAVAYTLLLPNVFTATTKLLPPQQAQSGASALLSQLGGAASLAGIAGVKSQGEVYIGMLMSRTVADRLIERFHLKKRYETPSLDKARRLLAKNTVITSGKDGMIGIAVDDFDQKFVAQLANGYVEELQRLSGTLAITEASQRRMFFEQQLEAAKNNLAKVEVSLKGAMVTGGVISVDSESRAILETAARLRAQVSAKEIQLGSMRVFVTAQNPEFQRTTAELSSLRSELAKLEGGRTSPAGSTLTSEAGLGNIQLMRDVKYYQMLYELLAKQYEVARLDEAKEPTLIQVLDPAVEPERKSGPKRSLIVIATTLMSLFAILVWALFTAARQRAMTMPAEAARWKEFRSYLRLK